MVTKEENTENNIRLSADEIQLPKPGMLERLLAGYFRKRTQGFISRSIHEYAVTDGGKIDNEMADYLRTKLTLRSEISMHRDVLEPTGWTAISGALMGAGGLAISKKVEGKAFTPASTMALVSSTALGACLDLYRVKRRFDSGLQGTLSGALQAIKEDRNPRWDRKIVEGRERDIDGDLQR